MPPQHTGVKQPDQIFGPDEVLYRQVANSHIEEGEVSIFAIRSETKFDPLPEKCTSVVRSKFTASYADAIHADCAGDKDISQTHTIMHVNVADLPKNLVITPQVPGPANVWDIYPFHAPVAKCYAHSTICCCDQSAPGISVCPPKSVRTQFRDWFSEALTPSQS